MTCACTSLLLWCVLLLSCTSQCMLWAETCFAKWHMECNAEMNEKQMFVFLEFRKKTLTVGGIY